MQTMTKDQAQALAAQDFEQQKAAANLSKASWVFDPCLDAAYDLFHRSVHLFMGFGVGL